MTGPSRRAILAGSTAALAIGPVVAGPLPAPFNPDAALMAACAENAARRQADNLAPEPDGALWRAYMETHDVIAAAEPQTMAGVLAKAWAAKEEAIGLDGEEQVEANCTASAWGWDVLNDMLRLVGDQSMGEVVQFPRRPRVKPPERKISFAPLINQLAREWAALPDEHPMFDPGRRLLARMQREAEEDEAG